MTRRNRFLDPDVSAKLDQAVAEWRDGTTNDEPAPDWWDTFGLLCFVLALVVVASTLVALAVVAL